MWMRGEKDAWHTFLDSSHFLRGQNSTRVLCRVCLAVGTADSPWQCISTFCNRNITTHTRLHLPSRLMVGWVSCFLSMASVFLWWHLLGTAVYFLWHLPHGWTCNLVDPASSYMLVSKIKPCMSQYKFTYCKTANGSLKQLLFTWQSFFTWITIVILELIHASRPDSRRVVLIRYRTNPGLPGDSWFTIS